MTGLCERCSLSVSPPMMIHDTGEYHPGCWAAAIREGEIES